MIVGVSVMVSVSVGVGVLVAVDVSVVVGVDVLVAIGVTVGETFDVTLTSVVAIPMFPEGSMAKAWIVLDPVGPEMPTNVATKVSVILVVAVIVSPGSSILLSPSTSNETLTESTLTLSVTVKVTVKELPEPIDVPGKGESTFTTGSARSRGELLMRSISATVNSGCPVCSTAPKSLL